MDNYFVLDLTQRAVQTTLFLVAPMLGGAVIVGICVSIFQAVTQINEQTLSFVPKILVIAAALVFFGPWMMDTMKNYTEEIIINIPNIVAGP